jgi:hypothetical protein
VLLGDEVMIVPGCAQVPESLVPVKMEQYDHPPMILRSQDGGFLHPRRRAPSLLDESFVRRDSCVGTLGRDVYDGNRPPCRRRKDDRRSAGVMVGGRVMLTVLVRPRH